jgi:hypothetical protein
MISPISKDNLFGFPHYIPNMLAAFPVETKKGAGIFQAYSRPFISMVDGLSRMADDFIVDHPRFEFEQEIPVLRIVFCLLEVVTGEAPNGIQTLPEGKGDEVGDIAFQAFEDMNTDISRDTLIIGYRPLVGKFPIRLRLAGGDATMPHADNHCHLHVAMRFLTTLTLLKVRGDRVARQAGACMVIVNQPGERLPVVLASPGR